MILRLPSQLLAIAAVRAGTGVARGIRHLYSFGMFNYCEKSSSNFTNHGRRTKVEEMPDR